jgi:hypothetical protein
MACTESSYPSPIQCSAPAEHRRRMRPANRHQGQQPPGSKFRGKQIHQTADPRNISSERMLRGPRLFTRLVNLQAKISWIAIAIACCNGAYRGFRIEHGGNIRQLQVVLCNREGHAQGHPDGWQQASERNLWRRRVEDPSAHVAKRVPYWL